MDKVYEEWKNETTKRIDKFLRSDEDFLFEKMYEIIRNKNIPQKVDRFIDLDIDFDKENRKIIIVLKQGETLPIDIYRQDFNKGLKATVKTLWRIVCNCFHNYIDALNENDETQNEFKNIISVIREHIVYDHLSTDEHFVVIGKNDELRPCWYNIEYSFETMLIQKKED